MLLGAALVVAPGTYLETINLLGKATRSSAGPAGGGTLVPAMLGLRMAKGDF